jgi:FkbM family methyltransferase
LLVESERTILEQEAELDAARRNTIWKSIRTHLQALAVDRVFDVGANVGKTAIAFRRHFPKAEIWAFEPVKASFEQLVQSTAGTGDIRCFNLALGAESAAGQITANGTSTKNHLVAAGSKRDTQSVPIVAGGDFCDEHGIEHISYLKVDTEGHDLAVLRGFEPMLRDSRIDVVEVEAGMNPGNKLHVPLHDFLDLVEPHGYRLFRIFKQVSEKEAKGPYLRRVNVAFISPSVIERHRGVARSLRNEKAALRPGSRETVALGRALSSLADFRAALRRRLKR